MGNEKRLIDGNKAKAVLVNMAEHLLEAGNPEMAGAVGYAAEVIGKQRTVDAVVLPCNIGDILYTFCIKGIDDYFIRESTVSRIEISEDFGTKIIERRKDTSGAYFYFQIDIGEIGQSIFLTKEEALKKMGR